MSSSYLSRSVTPSTATSWTVSFWFKLTNINPSSGTPYLWSCGSTSGGGHGIYYNNSTDVLRYYGHTGYADAALSSGALRDTNAWYHIVLSVNAGTGTSYLNGVQQGSTISNIGPLNAHTGNLMAVNAYVGGLSTYDDSGVYMSHFHFIDGTAYAASTFGSTDSTTGEWKINTSPSVTYGTNGFFLFKDNASVNDQSGNGNNFTSSGTITPTEDCPSNVFATWNIIMNNAEDGTWSNGNTTIAPNGDGTYLYAPTTIGVSSGKWYSEHMITGGNGYGMLGAISEDNIVDGFRQQTGLGSLTNSFGFRCRDGAIRMGSSNITYGSAPGTSDAILGMALDMDNKKVWYHVNGTYVTYGGGVGNPGAGTYGFDFSSLSGDTFLITCGDDTSGGYGNFKSNFGNGYFGTTAISSEGTNASGIGKFEYDVPTGYTALSTKGLNE